MVCDQTTHVVEIRSDGGGACQCRRLSYADPALAGATVIIVQPGFQIVQVDR